MHYVLHWIVMRRGQAACAMHGLLGAHLGRDRRAHRAMTPAAYFCSYWMLAFDFMALHANAVAWCHGDKAVGFPVLSEDIGKEAQRWERDRNAPRFSPLVLLVGIFECTR